MKSATNKNNTTETWKSDSSASDRGLTFREVNALLGLNCKTSHTIRSYAARGLIRRIDLNSRVVRFSRESVEALLAGKAAA